MWRDPLDELIEELERIVPAKAAKPAFDPMEFQEMADRLDRMSLDAVQAQSRRDRTGVDEPASTVATPPAAWPTRPTTRRPDPSAPWDYTGDSDADDSDG